MFQVIILDTLTGNGGATSFDQFTPEWWMDNGSCDCNRLHAVHGRIAAYNSKCLGSHRFLIIGFIGDSNGYTLTNFNRYYPSELLERYGITADESI